MAIIKTKDLVFEYIRRDEEGNVEGITRAVNEVDIDVKQGDFVAILGHNGSGKSTLAKHINAILYPTEGTVWVDGMDTTDEKRLWDIRQNAGMVFQNPDNQIVANVVEEDVAFGPENLGVASPAIRHRVDAALKQVGMYEYREHAPHLLSGGQKQRIAIAGVLALKPKIMILDESTAMLDPQGRKEVMNTILKLNRECGMTILHITHNMEEAVLADRVVVKAVEAEEKTKGGLILTASAQEKPQIAEVVAVGPGGLVDGKEVVMTVKVGDRVITSKYSGTEVKADGVEYNIVRQGDILAIVE